MDKILRKVYYGFPHIGLPMLFFDGSGENLYKSFNIRFPEEEATRLWRTLAQQFGTQSNEVLGFERQSINRNHELIVLTLPNPTITPEAYYIGMLFKIDERVFRTKVEAKRYFVLELGDLNKYFLCEWSSTKEHINHGEVRDNNLNNFILAVKSIVINGTLDAELEVEYVNTSNGKPTAAFDEIIKSREESKNKMIEVVNRWSDQIPTEIYNKAIYIATPNFKIGEVLIAIIQNSKQMPENELMYIKKNYSELAAATVKISMIIGYDSGKNQKCQISSLEDSSDVPEEIKELLLKVIEPLAFLCNKISNAYQEFSPNPVVKEADLLDSISEALFNCFKLGLEYAEETSKSSELEKEPINNKIDSKENKPYAILMDTALFDPDLKVRREAQNGVKELYPGGPEGFNRMVRFAVEQLRDPKERKKAANFLYTLNEMALPTLEIYLTDPDPLIRRIATQLIIDIQKDLNELKS